MHWQASTAPQLRREVELAAMVARDLPAMCAQHVGCLRAVVLSGSLYATMHIVREPSLLPVSLVFQYLASSAFRWAFSNTMCAAWTVALA